MLEAITPDINVQVNFLPLTINLMQDIAYTVCYNFIIMNLRPFFSSANNVARRVCLKCGISALMIFCTWKDFSENGSSEWKRHHFAWYYYYLQDILLFINSSNLWCLFPTMFQHDHYCKITSAFDFMSVSTLPFLVLCGNLDSILSKLLPV